MQERRHSKSTPGTQSDLDQRLAAYYGPQLREQPLAQSSWLHLRHELDQPRPFRRWRPPRRRMRRHRGQYTPVYVQDAFVRVAYEARMPVSPSLLRCRVNTRVRVPSVRVSLLSGRGITIALPASAEHTVQASELDVLLASGLARRLYMRTWPWLFLRLLLALVSLLSLGMLFAFWFESRSIIVLPIAVTLCVVAGIGGRVMGSRLVFHADRLVVRWLGRNRTCQGLHALADRARSASRSGWSEPTLTERIARVCGTRVEVEEERFTLIR